jgi:hypothetical protein
MVKERTKEFKESTYLCFIETHQPVDQVVKDINARVLIFATCFRRVREINARYSFVLPPSAERVLVVQQAELLDDIVHDEVGVDTGLGGDELLVRLTKLHYLIDF